MWSHGKFYWNELMTHQPDAARRFYGAALGWTFEGMPMPNGTYWMAKAGEEVVGGIFPMSGPEFEGAPETWFAYIAVDDVDTRAKAAVTAGGQLLRDLFDVPGIGRIAILRDPNGAMIGYITPAS